MFASTSSQRAVVSPHTQGLPPSQLAKVEDPELKEFIKVCIRFDPMRRPTAGKLLRHPFLASVNPDVHRTTDSRMSFEGYQTPAIPEVPSSEWGGEVDMALDSLDEENVFNPRSRSFGSLELEPTGEGLFSQTSSAGHVSEPSSLEKPHKVLMTSLQDLSGEYSLSPPMLRLDSQTESFLGSSPSRRTHRRHSSISLEAAGEVAEAAAMGPGRRWQVDIVGDNGEEGEGKLFQLRFTGFQDGVSFQRFQSDFPADANEDDYIEFTTEVVQDEKLGILESDANSIVAEIQERLREALIDNVDVIAAAVVPALPVPPLDPNGIAVPGNTNVPIKIETIGSLVRDESMVGSIRTLPVLETRKIMPRQDSGREDVALEPLSVEESQGWQGQNRQSNQMGVKGTRFAPADITVSGFSVASTSGQGTPAEGQASRLRHASSDPVPPLPQPQPAVAPSAVVPECAQLAAPPPGNDDDTAEDRAKILAKHQSRMNRLCKKKPTSAQQKKPPTYTNDDFSPTSKTLSRSRATLAEFDGRLSKSVSGEAPTLSESEKKIALAHSKSMSYSKTNGLSDPPGDDEEMNSVGNGS